MLKVKVFVNDRQIDEVNIWNMSENYGEGKQIYRVFNSQRSQLFDINHNYDDGYWKLITKVVSKLKDRPKPKTSKRFKKFWEQFNSGLIEKLVNENSNKRKLSGIDNVNPVPRKKSSKKPHKRK